MLIYDFLVFYADYVHLFIKLFAILTNVSQSKILACS